MIVGEQIMELRFLGIFGLILGLSILSLEGFLLRTIQMMDETTGSWFSDITVYAKEPILCISILITVFVVIWSIVCIFLSRKKAEEKEI